MQHAHDFGYHAQFRIRNFQPEIKGLNHLGSNFFSFDGANVREWFQESLEEIANGFQFRDGRKIEHHYPFIVFGPLGSLGENLRNIEVNLTAHDSLRDGDIQEVTGNG